MDYSHELAREQDYDAWHLTSPKCCDHGHLHPNSTRCPGEVASWYADTFHDDGDPSSWETISALIDDQLLFDGLTDDEPIVAACSNEDIAAAMAFLISVVL